MDLLLIQVMPFARSMQRIMMLTRIQVQGHACPSQKVHPLAVFSPGWELPLSHQMPTSRQKSLILARRLTDDFHSLDLFLHIEHSPPYLARSQALFPDIEPPVRILFEHLDTGTSLKARQRISGDAFVPKSRVSVSYNEHMRDMLSTQRTGWTLESTGPVLQRQEKASPSSLESILYAFCVVSIPLAS
jgi:hypothetical protein